MKTTFYLLIIILIWNKLDSQEITVQPIENVFEVEWIDSVRMEYGAPLINGNLVIPPYGSDHCYMTETGEKLYYTYSPQRDIIKKNMASRYILFKSDWYNIIFDLETGKEVYKSLYKKTEDKSRNPFVANNQVIQSKSVFFASSLNTLTCVDTSTMKERWTFTSEDILYDKTLEHNGVVYVGSNKFLYALDVNSGNELWKIEVGKVISNMEYKNDRLIICVEKKGLISINTTTKEIVFEQKYALDVRKISINDSLIYYVDNTLYAFKFQNGELVFYTEGYEPCTNTDAYFIYKNYIFSQDCENNQRSLEGFDRYTGKIAFKRSKVVNDKRVLKFLQDGAQFSVPYKNMIFVTSMRDLADGFFYSRIYGVRIKDEKL